jgi:glycosyltransferase involved in cell wall biosynthesis
MTVLVAIPYYRNAEYIGQAVASALNQSYADMRILVACDGEPLEDSEDWVAMAPFVRTVTFPTNEGAPLTQQAMLLGSPFEWYAPMGADDWLDPEYIERLLSLGTKANASGEIWHNDTEQSLVHDRAHTEFGVFDADLLRSVGGYGIDRRCGQDTLLYEDILPHVYPVTYLDVPNYHKRLHPGSLTADPATGYGSAYRAEVVTHNHEVRAYCESFGWDPVMIRTYRDRLAASLLDVLGARVAMVREALA